MAEKEQKLVDDIVAILRPLCARGEGKHSKSFLELDEIALQIIQQARPGGKAPLLTNKEIIACQGTSATCDDNSRAICKAQNDADNKWYSG